MRAMQGKCVVVTGASMGIGEELSVALAARGANLVLAARSEEALQRVKQRCEAAGGKAVAVATDVGDPEACRRMVEKAVEAFGGVDVLVNNAGISMDAKFEDVTDLGIFERLMRINYLGAVYCTHAALPYLKARRGLLVAISSLTGKTGVPTRTGYAASKHAMHGFFDSLRVELMGTGVDVTVVCPGFVSTNVRANALGKDGKPLQVSAHDESEGNNMDVATCVAIILRAMDQREREVVMTTKGKVGQYLKLFTPGLLDRIVFKTIQDRRR
ncbi:SDR family oxidoreductase [Myxococcus sp. MISCRS1]|jgi:short-subunit dehydrogenase|uniref:SDR family oxidoreductase n=1 Tax=Myxococcus TaxID=32 RepID=UPI001CC100F5|nr:MULTISPECIES: SDR family oxidoreductase [unclassified Myxococcus]MBZ4407401.1 SDR family oxidoreductase [Myxococcus sp. XM-1-1-1]MCY0998770.1 SDR family oxidoreductase [Myxococcus sp. MISCRS1]BDT31230.1 SDR family oxidoreductase [Myxococcus sp. MH1]